MVSWLDSYHGQAGKISQEPSETETEYLYSVLRTCMYIHTYMQFADATAQQEQRFASWIYISANNVPSRLRVVGGEAVFEYQRLLRTVELN